MGAVCAPWRMAKRRETGSLQKLCKGDIPIAVEQGRRDSWKPPQRSTERRVLPRGRLGTCGARGRLLLSCRSAATERGQCSGKRGKSKQGWGRLEEGRKPLQKSKGENLCCNPGLNQEPLALQPNALPAELLHPALPQQPLSLCHPCQATG